MRYKKNKRQNPYKIENENFLSEKAKEEQLPALFRVRELIMGWQIAQL